MWSLLPGGAKRKLEVIKNETTRILVNSHRFVCNKHSERVSVDRLQYTWTSSNLFFRATYSWLGQGRRPSLLRHKKTQRSAGLSPVVPWSRSGRHTTFNPIWGTLTKPKIFSLTTERRHSRLRFLSGMLSPPFSRWSYSSLANVVALTTSYPRRPVAPASTGGVAPKRSTTQLRCFADRATTAYTESAHSYTHFACNAYKITLNAETIKAEKF